MTPRGSQVSVPLAETAASVNSERRLHFSLRLRKPFIIIIGGGWRRSKRRATWCSNQWKRDLKQNTDCLPLYPLASFHSIDLVLERKEYFWKIMSILREDPNVQKCAAPKVFSWSYLIAFSVQKHPSSWLIQVLLEPVVLSGANRPKSCLVRNS